MRALSAIGLCFLGTLAVAVAAADVTVGPERAEPGVRAAYTMRVASDADSITTAVELEVPEGVEIVSVEGPADSYELKRAEGRVVAITWRMSVEPGRRAEYLFVAQNPGNPGELVWKVHQHHADGTVAHWSGLPGTPHPASITKLAPCGCKRD